VRFDSGVANIAYRIDQRNTLEMSGNGGGTWGQLTLPGAPAPSGFHQSTLVVGPDGGEAVVALQRQVYFVFARPALAPFGGPFVTQILSTAGGPQISALAYAPTFNNGPNTGNLVYVGYTNGTITALRFNTSGLGVIAGSVTTANVVLPGGWPNVQIRSLAVDPVDPGNAMLGGTLYVGFDSLGIAQVWRRQTAAAGAVWSPISGFVSAKRFPGALPNLAVYAIAVDHVAGGTPTVFVGNEAGIWGICLAVPLPFC
jgi:hypothetical protein